MMNEMAKVYTVDPNCPREISLTAAFRDPWLARKYATALAPEYSTSMILVVIHGNEVLQISPGCYVSTQKKEASHA
jgi:hypothetical protein